MRVFSRCLCGMLLATYGAFAQTPAPSDPSAPAPGTAGQSLPADPQTLPGQPPLTPEQLRQKEIDKYDPLKRNNPLDPGIPGTGATPPGGAPAGNTQPASPYAPPKSAPLPGSVADSDDTARRAHNDGPQVVDDASDSAASSYHGPAVLSRSYTLARPTVPKDLKWQWTVSTGESYQTGLQSATAGKTGTSAFGDTGTFTFTGRHLWKRDQLGVQYGASYSNYTGSTSYDGVNQNLSLDYGHEFSSRLAVNLVETGSIVSSNYSLQNPLTAPGVSAANISLAASPGYQVPNQRTRQFQTTASLTWQKSSRLSFNMSGGFFAVDRGSGSEFGQVLASNVGYQSQADVNYRYTSRMTVGAYYSYTTYTFTKHESVSNTNTVGLIYSYAFNRSTQLRLRYGTSQIESLAYVNVSLTPLVAFLTGQATGILDNYRRNSTSDISGQFVRDFGRNRTFNVSYARGVAPGNGLILTAIQKTYSASYSMKLFRRFNVNLTGGRNELQAQAQNNGSYTTSYGALSISRQLPRGVTTSFSVNYTLYDLTSGMQGTHPQWAVNSGFSWGPGPGKLW